MIQHVIDGHEITIICAPKQMTTMVTPTTMLWLIGDSDMDRWPKDCLPRYLNGNKPCQASVAGYSGATLGEVVDRISERFATTAPVSNKRGHDGRADCCGSHCVLVVCAGENDIGQGYTLDNTLQSMDRLLEWFGHAQRQGEATMSVSTLVFFGPKFEPWLQDDHTSRKQYVKMSKGMRRRIDAFNERNPKSQNWSGMAVFCDCITMFCTDETKSIAGAQLGGLAVVDTTFFDDDGLHLSKRGYDLWQAVLEGLDLCL